ncbi:MAG: hypothetical protein H6716_28280 [Polyangiaceae bacterium]|nr:hypothetical protein [Polyangiaceae bacterium]
MDIQQGKARTLRFVPQAPMSAPTARVVTRKALELATPDATPHAGATTVADDGDNTAQRFKVADASDFSIGDTILVTDDSWGSAPAVLSSVDGVWMRTVEPLPATPRTGATLVGLDVVVVLPVDATAELALDSMVIVEEGEEQVTQLFNVVAFPFRGPVLPIQVRDYVSRLFQGESNEDETWYGRIADECNGRIRGRLLASDAYLSRYWDPDALAEIGANMMQLVLAGYGYYSTDGTREDYMRSLRLELKERFADILKGSTPYDGDGDGDIDDDEVDGSTTVRGTR